MFSTELQCDSVQGSRNRAQTVLPASIALHCFAGLFMQVWTTLLPG